MLPNKRLQCDAHEPRRVFAYCTLPPHHERLAFESAAAFESHYLADHAFRCAVQLPISHAKPLKLTSMRRAAELAPRCGKTFPSAHFLNLHVEECHSALAAERQKRGEPIFACFEQECGRYFLMPKTRRQHLISVHHYPPEFFFSLPNHGMGELKERYGQGASLVRKPWRPRGEQQAQPPPKTEHSLSGAAQDSASPDTQIPPRFAPKREFSDQDDSEPEAVPEPSAPSRKPPTDELLESLSALSLVPRQLRK